MSYLTVEVEIDHGRVSTKGAERLPAKASGLLTIFPATENGVTHSPLQALELLQKKLSITTAGAAKWINTVQVARR